MAKNTKNTNASINTKSGRYDYCRIKRKVGMKQNKRGEWVPEYKQFYGKTYKEAKAKFDNYISAGALNSSSCFGELISWYIDNIFLPDSKLKETTKTIYINAYHAVFDNSRIIGRSLDQINGAELQAVISSDILGAGTRKQALKLIKHFYKYLEAQHITENITHGLIAPAAKSKSTSQEIEIFTDQELAAFIDHTPVDHRLRLLIVLAINTGARIAELLALTYDDISVDQIRINKSLSEIEPLKNSNNKTIIKTLDTKTRSSVRSLPISNEVHEEVLHHRQWHKKEMIKNGYRTDRVFTTSSGKPYYQATLRKSFNRLCSSLEIEPRGFHTFRRTFGTKLAAGGVPIQTLSKLMGHADISVTAKYYINISDNEKIAALSALAINRA